MNTFKELAFQSVITWLPIAVLATMLALVVYGTVQHSLRSSANDPQIQLSEDAARLLEKGESPHTFIPAISVDMAKTLTPFLIVFEENGNPIATSVLLDDKPPIPPKGVLEYAKTHGSNRITWQPRPDVRAAIVVVPYGGDKPGYVLAGRSLREVERRSQWLVMAVSGAWVVTMVGTFLAVLLGKFLLRPTE